MHPPRKLLEKCRFNDRKAHHELYVMCFPVLYSVCSRYHINRDDRMSSLNMIFLKIITGMGNYLRREEDVPFEAWMRKVAIRYIIDEFRKQRKYRETIILIDRLTDEDEPSDREPWAKYDEEEILLAIETLPLMSRTVFNLFAIDGYRHDEISELLGISTGTSKAHLFKARKKLQEILLSAPRVRKQ